MRTPADPDETPESLARLLALSDGVFAIAITLLVLDIVPHIPASVTGSRLLDHLRNMAPSFTAYLLSFLVIGRFWDYHRSMFVPIHRADPRVIWGNLLLLLWITLIPASASLLGSHSEEEISVVLYGINLLLATLSVWSLWRYVSSSGFVRRERLTPGIDRYVDRILGVRAAGYALTILVAIASPHLALLVAFLTSALPRKLNRPLRARSEEP